MRAFLPAYDLIVPKDLPHALGLMKENPFVYTPIAGGTDIMVLLEAGHLEKGKFLSIWHLPELKGIAETQEFVTLGALTTYTEILEHSLLEKEFQLLWKAAHLTGAVATQNRGTLGGNIVNASPAADTPPALLAYDAEVELTSSEGSRWVSYADFHLDYKKTIKRPEELLTRVRLPRKHFQEGKRFHSYYRKVGTRNAQAISKVCFAGWVETSDKRITDLRIVLGAVAPTVVRCMKTEAVLRNQEVSQNRLETAKMQIYREINPISDIRSTQDYRRQVARNLLEAFLEEVFQNVGLV